MAALSKKLQVQSVCTHQSQQPSLFHRHKKPEFLSDLMGSKAISLSVLD